MSCCGNKKDPILSASDPCCTSNSGCNDFNRKNLCDVKVEPIFVQKVYDAALVHSSVMIGGPGIAFEPTTEIDPNSRIVKVLDIRCRRYCENGEPLLELTPSTTLNGAVEVGAPVIGPDGEASQQPIYVDTEDCDEECLGTKIYGQQTTTVTGEVLIAIDVLIREDCGRRCKVTLEGLVPVNGAGGIATTDFFELCVPSTTSGAFLPRFTEFCNVSCEPRLITGRVDRDFEVISATEVEVDIFVALCIACEKKIVVPVQLCVLSTGFPQLSPTESSICNNGYPSLFPRQTDQASVDECLKEIGDENCHKPHRPHKHPRYQGLELSDECLDDIDEI